MSDNPKEAEREMEKAIFISADCWLEVFDLLPPAQLGLGIALISHRFDYYVDEHFKTRKWKLDKLEIRRKIGQNDANEMKIVNSNGKALPIPQNPLPNKVIGFRYIFITFFDQNVITFLRHFQRFFATCSTDLFIDTANVRISEFIMRNIWSMFNKDTICEMTLNSTAFGRMRQLAPTMLNDCPPLRLVAFKGTIFPAFPPDDSANASDGQAVAKWLFTPRPDNLPNMLNIEKATMEEWSTNVEQIKAAFSSASSPVNFFIYIEFPPSSFSAVVPFKLTNEFTGERLTLSQEDQKFVKLIRCPIAPYQKKWKKAMNEFFLIGQNKIDIFIRDGGVDDGLLDDLPGPSGDQKQKK